MSHSESRSKSRPNRGIWPARYSLHFCGSQISTHTAAPTTITSPPGSTARNSRKPSGEQASPSGQLDRLVPRGEQPPEALHRGKPAFQPSGGQLLPHQLHSRVPLRLPNRGLHKLKQPGRSLASRQSLDSTQSGSANSLGIDKRQRSSSVRWNSPRRNGCVPGIGQGLFARKWAPFPRMTDPSGLNWA